jgi:two-component sensor histidine kinase
MPRLTWGPLGTIRFRLAAAVALALAPVLVLGAAQATLAFRKDADEERTTLALATARSAAASRAQLEGAGVLLETLAPQSVGFACAQRLAQVSGELSGYQNLIRFDADGRVACAGAPLVGDPGSATAGWFQSLALGAPTATLRAPDALSPSQPAVLAAQRLTGPGGRFEGALAAIISLDSLRPSAADPALPRGTEVALADEHGRFLTRADAGAFPASAARGLVRPAAAGSVIEYGQDRRGETRVYSTARLAGDVFVVLSAPAPGWLSWARLNLFAGVLLPLLAFFVALVAVLVVTERVVVRWLNYLQRIADIYARGRFSVRPLKADRAAPEIRNLAHALDVMADVIVTRDRSLHATLEEKDALMREIHHRVRNNLQVISSLISMQQRALGDPAAREAMFDTRQRINALALIYRALYQGADLKKVDIRQFLGDLIAQLIVEQQEHGELVATDLEADALIIDPDKLAPIALFAVEAIGNAQKHALSVRGGVLRVRFNVVDAEAVLEINDEGCGVTPELVSTGVGRQLMTAFARQLRGRMELVENDLGGVTARLIFPTPQARGQARPSARGRGNRAAA